MELWGKPVKIVEKIEGVPDKPQIEVGDFSAYVGEIRIPVSDEDVSEFMERVNARLAERLKEIDDDILMGLDPFRKREGTNDNRG